MGVYAPSNDGVVVPVVGLGNFCVRFGVKITPIDGLLKRYPSLVAVNGWAANL